jgi:hypothetical protein
MKNDRKSENQLCGGRDTTGRELLIFETKMKPSRKLFFTCITILLAAVVLLRTYARDADDDEDKRQAVKLPSRLSVENGRTVITLDAIAQKRLGLATAVLRSTGAREEETAAATILSPQGLLTLQNTYIATRAQIQKAQASVDVSEQEYQRLKNLYERNQDTSKKSVEAAEGVLRTDQANLSASQQDLALQKFAVQQSWGSAIAGWISAGRRELDEVLSQSSLLVQVTLPPERSFDAPQRITLSTPAGQIVKARYLSPLPRVDPLIQRATLLYSTLSRPSLAPGMNLIARLPEGPIRHGLLIPDSSVVWWQGEAWVYEQVGPTRFVRLPLVTDTPLPGGYFASTGFSQGNRVVVHAAQFLLSEEFRSQIQAQD